MSPIAAQTNHHYFFLLLGCFCIVIGGNIFIPGYANGFSIDPQVNLYELWSNEAAMEIWRDRWTDPVFHKRIILLGLQKGLREQISLPFQGSFNLINLISLIGIVYFIIKIGRKFYHNTNNESYSATILFLLALPMVFAFGGYVSSYDDWLQYWIILVSFYFFYCQEIFWCALFLLFGTLIRETTFMYGIVFLMLPSNYSFSKRLLYFGAIMIIFGLIWVQHGNNAVSWDFLIDNRMNAWKANLASNRRIVESFVCIIWILAWPVALMLKSKLPDKEKRPFVLLILFNLILVFTTALIHETRLLFFSIILIYPMISVRINYNDLRL
jgi:hypothetical protein